ncbi:MAG: CRISPR-associated helicase Cas3' [Polyangiaceae bacterium]|nr:CRISPR-associated helicase Cas3' [Polyangiaceae bacterium]
MAAPSHSPEVLHAKSKTYGLSLHAHLMDARQAARALFQADRRWGRAFARFFRLPDGEHERFLIHLQAAALLHDIGKANEDFQRAVTAPGFEAQTMRHEHLSALFMHLPPVWQWLSGARDVDLPAIAAAVLSHHLKAAETADHDGRAPVWGEPQKDQKRLFVFFDHPDVTRMLATLAEVLGLGPPPEPVREAWSLRSETWERARSDGRAAARRLRLDRDEGRRRFVMALKAGLIAADSAASALVREGLSIEDWIAAIACARPLGPEDVDANIITPRIRAIEERRGEPFQWRDFQIEIARIGRRGLLLSACGSGKTLAAWSWARAQLAGNPAGRVIFLYPTRGTANEGFRDYVAWAPEAEASLVHSSARYELDQMRDNPPEAARGKSFAPSDAERRLFALGLWAKKYFSATVDQFLGFLEHQYTGMCLLPALADSIIIIDEVHSFDPHLFDNLERFLKVFDVPVLCMTATLPADRRKRLEDAALVTYPTEAAPSCELLELESAPRYRLRRISGEDEALELCAGAYEAGQRVLWVVNTVARCQNLAERVQGRIRSDVLCYHSRYLLRDRRDMHARTVSAFQQSGLRAVAVTTQVCEMSLDLDADVLITEHAPVPSLIQRFGRANRHLKRDRAQLYTYAPPAALPYERAELAAAERFLADVEGKDLGQIDLASGLRHVPAQSHGNAPARFESGGYYAVPGQLRDIEESGCTAILDTHVDEVRALLERRSAIDEHLLSIPRRDAVTDDPRLSALPRYLALAPASHYDSLRGFRASQGGNA